ncbi:MAG: hypothetical protein HZA80_03140 [Candidatus Taylorbacteria bacterium]|nr:hypothetical protein [Candidatus Taylorbacteria bacterium]
MSEVAPHITCTILWNGGWDDYLVDISETTDAPATGIGPDWWKHHPNGTFTTPGGWWILCRYLNYDQFNGNPAIPNPQKGRGVYPDTKGIRILKHLGGGD